jgi:hypothetical protein
MEIAKLPSSHRRSSLRLETVSRLVPVTRSVAYNGSLVAFLLGPQFARHRIRMFTESKFSNLLQKTQSVVVTIFAAAILLQTVVPSLDLDRRGESSAYI